MRKNILTVCIPSELLGWETLNNYRIVPLEANFVEVKDEKRSP